MTTPLEALTEALAYVGGRVGYSDKEYAAAILAHPAMADLARKAAAADELRQALRRWLPARMDLIPDEMWGRLQPYWEQDDATLAADPDGTLLDRLLAEAEVVRAARAYANRDTDDDVAVFTTLNALMDAAAALQDEATR